MPTTTLCERSGHADPRTLHGHYLVVGDGDRDRVVEVLDQAAAGRR